jgi:uncharacterized protein (TIGR02246 family)
VSVAIPEVINAYFRAIDEGDADAMVACFTDDAEVTDEGTSRRGANEIRAWREETTSAYQYRAEAIRVERDGDRYVATTRVTGNFPGSPVEMDYAFTLRGGLIRRLDIES